VNAFSALEEIPFADGEIKEINLDADGLVVLFSDWREKRFEFVFPDHHWMSELYAINTPLDRLEIVSEDPMLDRVAGLFKSEGLPQSAWVSLRMVNFIGTLDPHPALSVIAEGLEVRELEDDVG
jgi:hypothetical protein